MNESGEGRQPEVLAAGNKLEMRLNQLGELVHQLKSRLNPIMRQTEGPKRLSDNDELKTKAAAEFSTPLAGELNALAEQAQGIIENGEDALERIEI